MEKRHLQNCLSKEKRQFESNIKKYKRLIEIECDSVQSENPIKLESVPTISEKTSDPALFIPTLNEKNSEPAATTCAGSWCLNEFNTGSSPKVSTFVEANCYSNILALLNQIIQCQNKLNTRLEKLEQNQTNVLQNQSVLCNGHAAIIANQQLIADKIDKLEVSIVSKPEMMAQSKLMMECKVAIKRVEKSVCSMTDETFDKDVDEIGSMLPLKTLEAVREVEDKLDAPDFSRAMITYIHKLRGTSEDVSSVIREIFTDDLLEKYNWEGRWEKNALGKLILFNKTLRDVFHNQGAFEFEKSVRKAVERSHHRSKQKKYLKK